MAFMLFIGDARWIHDFDALPIFFLELKRTKSLSTLYPIAIHNICCRQYSMQLNAFRIKVLRAQDDLVTGTREAAVKDLLNVSHHKFQHHHNYKGLVESLIVQVLIDLLIPKHNIACRCALDEHVWNNATGCLNATI